MREGVKKIVTKHFVPSITFHSYAYRCKTCFLLCWNSYFQDFHFLNSYIFVRIETILLIRSNQKQNVKDERGSWEWLFENSFYILSPGTRFLKWLLVIILQVVVWGVHLGRFLWLGIFITILYPYSNYLNLKAIFFSI